MDENTVVRIGPVLEALRKAIEKQTVGISKAMTDTAIMISENSDAELESATNVIMALEGGQVGSIDNREAAIDGELIVQRESSNILQDIQNEIFAQTALLQQMVSIGSESLLIQKREIRRERRLAREESVSDDSSLPSVITEPKDASVDFKGFSSLLKDLKPKGGIKEILKNLAIGGLVTYFLVNAINSFIEELKTQEFDYSKLDFSSVLDTVFGNPALAVAIGSLFFGKKFLVLGALANVAAERLEKWIKDGGLEDIGITGDMLGEDFVGYATAALGVLGFALFKLAQKGVMKAITLAGAAATTVITGAIKTGKSPDLNPKGAAAGTAALKPGEVDPEAPKPKPVPLSEDDMKKLQNISDEDLKKKGVERFTQKNGQVRYRDMSTKKQISAASALEKGSKSFLKGSAESLAAAAAKYPNFGKFVRVMGPIVGTGAAIAEIAYLLNNEELSPKERGVQISGAIGSLFGGAGGAYIGGALGSLIPIPIVGTLIGALGGGIGGSIAGDILAEKYVGPWIMGGQIENADPLSLPNEVIEASEENAKPIREGQPKGQVPNATAEVSTTSTAETPVDVSDADSPVEVVSNEATVATGIDKSIDSSTAIIPNEATLATGMNKVNAIEGTAMQAFASTVLAPSVVGGNNIINNNKAGDASVVYNITNSPSKSLSNAVPIPMSANAWG